MSVTVSGQDNVDEYLHQSDQASSTVNYEKMLRLNSLIKNGAIERDYIKHSTKMNLVLHSIEPSDWDTICEEISNKEYPLQELQISWEHIVQFPVKYNFTPFAKTIGTHPTLTKLDCSFYHDPWPHAGIVLFNELKNNHSIKYMRLKSEFCNLDIVHTFGEILLNNQILLSLDISVFRDPGYETRFDLEPPTLIDAETTVELGRLLQTTTIQRLKIDDLNNECLKVLTEYLPETLVSLELTSNSIDQDSFLILNSYFKSNGRNLKEVILDHFLAEQYLQEQQPSLPRSLKILTGSSWQASVLCIEEPIRVYLRDIYDSDWFKSFLEFIEHNKICPKIQLVLKGPYDLNQSNNIKTLLSQQSPLTSLTIIDIEGDLSVQLELFRQLKENKSITELKLDIQMELNFFNGFVELLTNKTNIIRLDLNAYSSIIDEDAINLANALKNNTVLQKFTMKNSYIGDIGFQAILSSLPDSLCELNICTSQISSSSLPSLIIFTQSHSHVKSISLMGNGIARISTGTDEPDLIDVVLKNTYINHCHCQLDIKEVIKPVIAQTENDDDVINFDACLYDDHILELFNEIKKQPNRNWSLGLKYIRQLTSIGYGYLADLLSSTIPIVALYLGDTDMDEESRIRLLNGLRNNKILEKFSLSGCELNTQNIESIVQFIESNPNLKELVLNRCKIDFDVIIHLVNVLRKSTIEDLDLHENLIDDRGFATLLSSIPPTLTMLNVRNNQITETSLETILAFLATNRTLKNLRIYGENPIYNNEICYEQIQQAAKEYNIEISY